MLPWFLGLLLIGLWGLATPVAFLLAVAMAVMIGLMAHFLVFRPLRDAAPLGKVIGSLGVMLYHFTTGQRPFGSPVTVRGVKKSLLYSRDHTVAEGLEFVAGWNAAMLISEDLREAVSAYLQKRKPTFAD